MIKAALIVCFVAVALAAPTPEEIISYDAVDHKHEQTGEAGTAVKGSYSYTDVEGKTYTIEYVADENGYRAEGSHLPVAPEVPAVPEPVAEVAAEPVAEVAAEPVAEVVAEPVVETPAETPVVKAAETPASTATLVTAPVVRLAAPITAYAYSYPYAAYPYAAYPYAAPHGYSYGYSYGLPFYG